jgi:hypothetical protein
MRYDEKLRSEYQQEAQYFLALEQEYSEQERQDAPCMTYTVYDTYTPVETTEYTITSEVVTTRKGAPITETYVVGGMGNDYNNYDYDFNGYGDYDYSSF